MVKYLILISLIFTMETFINSAVTQRGQRFIPTFSDDTYTDNVNNNFTILFNNLIEDKFLNVDVCNTCTSISITFNKGQIDTNYMIIPILSWSSSSGIWVSNKTQSTCTINFSSPSVSSGLIDILLVR